MMQTSTQNFNIQQLRQSEINKSAKQEETSNNQGISIRRSIDDPSKDQKVSSGPHNQKSIFKVFEQKINQATEYKNNGNVYFKQKKYADAIKQYTQGLKLLDPSFFYGATESELLKMAQLSSNLLCNLGYCYFNVSDMHRAQIFFGQAITINPKYIKALHKRALARFQLKKYQESFQDIKIAFGLDKSNAQIHSAYSKILAKYNEQIKKSKQQMKQMSSKIFSNQSQKTVSPTKKTSASEQKHERQSAINEQNNKWSWPKALTFAGAALFIGTGIYRALKN